MHSMQPISNGRFDECHSSIAPFCPTVRYVTLRKHTQHTRVLKLISIWTVDWKIQWIQSLPQGSLCATLFEHDMDVDCIYISSAILTATRFTVLVLHHQANHEWHTFEHFQDTWEKSKNNSILLQVADDIVNSQSGPEWNFNSMNHL